MNPQKCLFQNILLEGVDGCGKTTIANEIIKRFPATRIIKRNAPKDQAEELSLAVQDLELLNSSSGLVFDRCNFLSNKVYSPIFRGYKIEEFAAEFLEKKLDSNTWLVYIDCEKEILEERYDGEFIEKNQIPKLIEAYRLEFVNLKIKNKIMIEPHGRKVENIVDEIIGRILFL